MVGQSRLRDRSIVPSARAATRARHSCDDRGVEQPDAQTMTDIPDLASLVEIAGDSTVSRTVLRGEGTRLVLFAFDAGQQLSEHTAAVPVLLQALDGELEVSAGGRTIALRPGGVAHIPARLPHSVLAEEPTRMLLTMLDPRMSSAAADTVEG